MSIQPKKKRTVAQLRADKEQRERDFDEGWQLVQDVRGEERALQSTYGDVEARQDRLHALLPQADRSYELLQHHPEAFVKVQPLLNKANFHKSLGNPRLGRGRPPPSG